MNFFRLVHLKNTVTSHPDALLVSKVSSRKNDQQCSTDQGRTITVYPSLFHSFVSSSKTSCEAPPPPPPPLPPGSSQMESPPLPPAPVDGEQDDIAAAAASVSAPSIFPNPGLYELATMDCKRILNLDTHDGFRVDINKQLSPYMAVVHNFWLGTSMLGEGRNKTYSFVTQVADEQGFLMARYDPARKSIDGRIHRAVLGGLATLKAQFNTTAVDSTAGDEQSNDQLLTEVDIMGGTWTANIKYGSMGGGNMCGCNFFQSITKNWSLGGEGMYIAVNRALLSNYTVKYNGNIAGSSDGSGDEATTIADAAAGGQSYSVVTQYNTAQQMLSVHYKRVVTPKRVTLAAQIELSPMSLESQVLFGAEFQLTRSKIGIVVDGEGKIQSVVEAKLGIAPGSPTLSFAAEVDHFKDQMRFGYGLNIGG